MEPSTDKLLDETSARAPAAAPTHRAGRPWGWPLALAVVVALLFVSNGLWAYQVVGQTLRQGYSDQQYDTTCSALKQALATLPRVVPAGAATSLVAAARDATPDKAEPFEKDGETVVGQLAFTFAPDGSLVRAEPTWAPFECQR